MAADLKLIKEQLVTVTTKTDTDIPSTLNFSSIVFEQNKEIEIDFPIPAKLKQIQIVVKGNIKKMTSSAGQPVEISHSITIDNCQSMDIFCSQYLKFSKDLGYEIYVLGKNGEPKEGITVNVGFMSKKISYELRATLETDKEGKVSLGHLQNYGIMKISS